MKIGIMGSGNIGGTAAQLFAEAGHQVAISNSRGPQSLRDFEKSSGSNIKLISIPFWFTHYGNIERVFRDTGPFSYIISSLGSLAYWTYFESTTGQSIGKRLLKIKTTNLSGGKIDIKSAILESFGKAFLLPFDAVLGWIFTNNKRQRIFNRIANTIVVKLKPKEIATAESIRYVKD